MKPEYIYMTVVAPAFILLPLITGFIRYRVLPAEARVLFYYFVLDALVSAASSLLAYRHLPNMPLYHISTVLETAVILYFFAAAFEDARFKRMIKRSIPFFVILGCLNSIFIQRITEFNSYTLSLQSAVIVSLCFLYLWHNENKSEKPWPALPLNWIISGMLLYFASSFVLLTFSNAIITGASKKVSVLLWNIHATLALLMYIFVSIGFLKYRS